MKGRCNMINNNKMNHGDIYFVDLPLLQGSVQGGRRPCVLMSNQLALDSSPVVVIIPLTSKQKKPQRTHTQLGLESGLKIQSTALCEQIITVSKERLINKIGKVPSHKMAEIAEAVKFQMAI
jgi:mRNA interferase MazF